MFIELPCKINDTVYCIATVHDALHPTFSWGCCEKYRIVKCTCKSIDVHLPINPVDTEYNPQIYCTDKTEDSKFTDFSFLLKPEDFGTRAFLSEEEARQMLYDMPEVKCGKWKIVYRNKVATVYECSMCGHLQFGTSDHCICGTKMEER